MANNKTQIHYEIKGVRFDRHGADRTSVSVARGVANVEGNTFRFELVLAPTADGQWSLVSLGWDSSQPVPAILGDTKFVQAIVNCSARLLDTINMWPSEQTDSGAKISLNERIIPEDVRDRVLVSFRPNILTVPSADWQYLWDHIERRVDADLFFEVLGFEKATLQKVLPVLRNVFTNDWVHKRYSDAGISGMADEFEPGNDGWFPAYHLARTAHGAICRDPGWNYLVEIGLALVALQEFEGFDQLKRQLAYSPGTQHHLCLASDLHERGLLKGLEPPTGIGTASNDLLVGLGERRFQVEVKEFTSRNPARRLRQEIEDKIRKLPPVPDDPIVFHVVLSENGVFDKERENAFFEAVANLRGDLPDKISAIVAGKRYVDSKGGRVKRETDMFVSNPTALAPIAEHDLRQVFETKYSDPEYPLYGIGTFFVFGNRPAAE